tara:strand:- start:2430 stop:3029 length:600 start_codon:yes stop_codon:yes gene_type:complete
MLPLDTCLPDFDLEVVLGTKGSEKYENNKLLKISNHMLSEKPILIMVICAHCPFVKHVELEITKLEKDYGESIQILAISSNSLITHPQDGPEFLARQANFFQWGFPYLIDSDQHFAKDLQAACTPDFFLFSFSDNSSHQLKYRGQLDESRPGNGISVTGEDLRAALNAVLNGQKVLKEQKPSIGCNIKWHPGKEPDWFG